jgi:hypothetical protein
VHSQGSFLRRRVYGLKGKCKSASCSQLQQAPWINLTVHNRSQLEQNSFKSSVKSGSVACVLSVHPEESSVPCPNNRIHRELAELIQDFRLQCRGWCTTSKSTMNGCCPIWHVVNIPHETTRAEANHFHFLKSLSTW